MSLSRWARRAAKAILTDVSIGIPAVQSKYLVRALIQTAKFESGQALFPKSALWLSELQAELLAFPAGRHDDQIDLIVQI